MGKRSRKRTTGPVRVQPAPVQPRPSSGRKSRVDRFIEKADARPKPPWHPVPLIELSVLAGIVLIVIGFINANDPQGRLAAVFGMALASLAGLDTAVRDHFSGFRSHTAVLSALPAVLVAIGFALLKLPVFVMLIGAVVTYAAGFFSFRNAFRKRTGVGFKV